jgi:ribosomal protein S27AE
MNDDTCCNNNSCGCRVDVMPTSKECPGCGRRLRLTGRAERLEFRLNCPNCGYTSSKLSAEELHDLI